MNIKENIQFYRGVYGVAKQEVTPVDCTGAGNRDIHTSNVEPRLNSKQRLTLKSDALASAPHCPFCSLMLPGGFGDEQKSEKYSKQGSHSAFFQALCARFQPK